MKRWQVNLLTWILFIPAILIIGLMSYLMYIWNISQWQFLILALLFAIASLWSYGLGKARRDFLIEQGYKK
jgi:hypothetical protein